MPRSALRIHHWQFGILNFAFPVRVASVAANLLGRNVIRGAERLARERQLGVGPEILRKTKIRDAGLVLQGVEEDVRGFEVAVDNASLVRLYGL